MSSDAASSPSGSPAQLDQTRARFPKSLAIAAAAVSIMVTAMVFVAQSVTKDGKWDGQFSGNWINGIGALIAVLNIVLTFYILRTALGQLDAFHHDMNSQAKRHAEQSKSQDEQARRDMERQEELRAIQTEQARADREQQEQLRAAQAEEARQEVAIQLGRVLGAATRRS